MANTPYSSDNRNFSDSAHLVARKTIYPRLFSTTENNLAYEKQEDILSNRGGALDADLSIDRVVKVAVNGFRIPFTFTFQERFRKPQYANNQDITLTEWNTQSNLPSELYKISANFFLYGYFDSNLSVFSDAIVVNVPSMMLAITNGQLSFTRNVNRRSNQPFLCITFNALHKAHLVDYHMRVDDLIGSIPF